MHTATEVAMRELDALEHRGEGTGEKVHELGNGVRLGVLVGNGDNPVGLLVEFPCPECQERVQWLIREGQPPNLGHSPPGCEIWKSSQADPTSTQARAYRAECQRLAQAAVEAAGGPERGGFDDDGPSDQTGTPAS